MADDALPQTIPPEVRTLSWVSFFADVSSEMIYPAIPLFVVGVLMAPARVLGVIEGVAEGLVSVMKGWAGWHSDKMGRRLPYVHWGYGLAAIGKPLMGLATAWPMVLVARGVDRFGKGIRGSARDAMIADVVDDRIAGRAFGFHRAMDTSGALVGVLIGTFLISMLQPNLRLVFYIATIPAVIAVAITFVLREHAPKPHPAEAAPPGDEPFSKSFYGALVVMSIFAIANSSDAFLLLRAKDLGFSHTEVALSYALFTFVYAILSYPLGALSDRVGRVPVLAAGWVAYALVYLGFASLGSSAVWPLMAIYGAYMSATDGVGKSLVSKVSPKSRKGAAMGVFGMVVGLCTLVGSVLAGVVWDSVGHAAPFYIGAALAAVSVAALGVYAKIEHA